MAIFDDIELEWNGVSYQIKGDDSVMRLLAAIEDHLTFFELERGRAEGRPPIAKISNAYATALRFAGCSVTPADVYNGMWQSDQTASAVTEAIGGLLVMMIPKSVKGEIEEEVQPATQKKSSSKKKSGTKQSSQRTKSQ